jgi:hypothetical protein
LAPEADPVRQNAPDVIELASQTASSQQQPHAISLDLDAVRQAIDRIATSIASSQERMTSSVDRIATSEQQITLSLDRMATSQDQIMRSLGQFTADQEQLTREVTKLQGIEQSVRSKNSEPSPRPVSGSASVPKPVSRPASASTPKSYRGSCRNRRASEGGPGPCRYP